MNQRRPRLYLSPSERINFTSSKPMTAEAHGRACLRQQVSSSDRSVSVIEKGGRRGAQADPTSSTSSTAQTSSLAVVNLDKPLGRSIVLEDVLVARIVVFIRRTVSVELLELRIMLVRRVGVELYVEVR